MNNKTICTIINDDAQTLSNLCNSLLKYLFDEEIPVWFQESFSQEEFEKRIQSEDYKHFGYMIENKIVGFIAIKEDNHLFHLFVDEKYHQQHIGKKLWEFVKENVTFETMSTNASLYAINVYESFGFVKEREIQTYKELEFLPMVYKKRFMMIYFSMLSVILLITMGLFHFYWILGGKIGLDKVIPTKENGEKFFNPSNLATTIVGVVLFGFAYLAYCLGFEILEESSLCIYLGKVVSIVFLLRVLGDFKMVGIFKRIKTTPFAKYDTLLFIPLCLYLGIYFGKVSLLF